MASSTTIPKTMKGVLIEETGGPEVLLWKTDLPVPVPKEGEVLVKNEFIGINYIDTPFIKNKFDNNATITTNSYFRTGLYPSNKPYILGREAEGTIVSLGPNSTPDNTYGLAVGDRVAWLGFAAYAEYAAVPALHTTKVPAALQPGQAAAALLQGMTALTLVREAHPTRAGEWVLVHAAAGGVGLWLVQILKAIGAHVIATASTPAKLELAQKAGADVLVRYTEDDVVAKVKEATGGEGVAAVFDGVGKATFDSSLEALKRKGSMVSFGNASGAVPPLTIARLSPKNIKLTRPMLFGYMATRAEFDAYSVDLFGLMTDARMDVRVHAVYPLQEVARAQQDLEARRTTGKLLLRP
ncbi:MAG: hypothetical protein M1819_001276 [Sarea resinae]|nr:MAG: hypothetical protein M1819_001276 [Sarea resinae]